MTRSRAVWLAVWWLAGAMPLAGQQWDAPEAVALRRAAALRRSTETAAPALGWRGTARGQLDWLVDVAPDAAAPITRRLTTDSLRAEVYGRGGGVSKQIVRDWRRGRALPADIRFHRDHLGIVTDGLGDRIRLGDGDEVRDVLHPLAPGADSVYEVALGDSLAVRGPGGAVRIRELLVRPRDPAASAAVGALDLDVESASLVRLRLGFTPAAYRDRTVESLTLVLEQARVAEGRWLPVRQQLEIRRRSAWADLEVRTTIRGTWTIEAEPDTTVTPDEVRGAPIVAPVRPALEPALARIAPSRSDDAAAAAEARVLVRRLAGARLDDARRGARLRVRGASGIAAFDRVQGLALGIGGAWRPAGMRLEADAGLGVSSRLATGGLRLAVPIGRGELAIAAARRVRDQADAPVISGALNSLRSTIAADDAGDWVLASEAGVAWRPSRDAATQLRLGAGLREARALESAATPLSGTFRPNVLPGQPRQLLLTAVLAAEREPHLRWLLAAEAGLGGEADYQRLSAEIRSTVVAGPGTFSLSGAGAALTADGPAWRALPLGGRGTLPGAPYRAWAGGALLRLDARWLAEVPIPAFRLHGPVTTGDRLRIGPYAGLGAVWSPRPATGRPTSEGLVPVAGVAVEPLWGLLRIEIGTSLAGEGAGRLRVVADVHPDWWPLL